MPAIDPSSAPRGRRRRGASLLLAWALGLGLALPGPPALAGDAPHPGDYVTAGGSVELPGEVAGDVYAAGGSILIKGRIAGDAVVAGGSVLVQGPVREDVYAVGGSVRLDGEIGGDARAAGGHVGVTRDARIRGRARLYGASVEMMGLVAGDLRAAGESVRLGGEVQGDAELTGREVAILPGAKIAGRLVYRSPQPAKIDPSARILGEITHLPMEPRRPPAPRREAVAAIGILGALVFMAGFALLGGLLLALFPGPLGRAVQTMEREPGKSLALGFALLVAIPAAGGILMATLVGIPLALLLLLLYPPSLMLGFLAAAFYLGEKGYALLRRGRPPAAWARFGWFVLALILMALVGAVPLFGGLALFLLLLLALGGGALSLYRAHAGQGAQRPS